MTSTQTITKTNYHYYFKVLALLAALAVTASLMVTSAAKPAHAAETTFIVNSAGNEDDAAPIDGHCDVDPATAGDQCTINAALTEATLNPAGSDIIKFNIPGSGVHTIKPRKELVVPSNVTIDGYSQTDAHPNTLEQGDNAAIRIELDGSEAGANANGLRIFSSNVVIKGLAINNYRNNGILISDGQNNKVEGNFIGTDFGGFIAKPNTDSGVQIKPLSGADKLQNNTIGGTTPAARNVLSGNFGSGVDISDPFVSLRSTTVTGNSVVGNFIGTGADGATSLGNTFGVSVFDASDNTVGGTTSAEANTIAFNQPAGVAMFGNGVGNRVLSNSIFSNSIGIDLGGDGVTANDTGDGDPAANEPGPNELQNFPVLSSAKTGKRGTIIKGTLNSIPNKDFKVQFFASPDADSSGNGEGKTFLGETNVTTGADANATFAFKPTQKVTKGQFVTATATDADGNTSEFSAAKKVVRR